jgi:uncharacterized protein (TIGR00251 family)
VGADEPAVTGFAPVQVGTAVRFSVRLQPRASRNELSGLHGGDLRIRVQAPPVDGAANAALLLLVAQSLGVPRRNVRLLAGDTSRRKVVEVDGVTAAQVARLARGTA